MKNFTLFFLLLILISCSSTEDMPDMPNTFNNEDCIEIPIEVSANDTFATRALYQDTSIYINHPILGDLRTYIPKMISCRVYYEDRLLACSNVQHPTDSIITSATAVEDASGMPIYRFIIRFKRAMDPSKIKLAFASQRHYHTLALDTWNIEDPFNDDMGDSVYESNVKFNNNNYFGIFTLSDTSDWSKIKKSFILKNIGTYICILTDEFIGKEKNPYEKNYGSFRIHWSATSMLDCKSARNYKEFLDMDYASRPIVYQRTQWNFFTDETKIVSYDLLNTYPYYNRTLRLFLDEDDNNWQYSDGGLVNYNGRKVQPTNLFWFVFPKNWRQPTIGNGPDGLLNSSDLNSPVQYVKNMVYLTHTYHESYVDEAPDKFCYYYFDMPIPSDGFKQNKIYLIINRPGTKLFNLEMVDFIERRSEENVPEINFNEENMIIEEYDFDDPQLLQKLEKYNSNNI